MTPARRFAWGAFFAALAISAIVGAVYIASQLQLDLVP